MLQHFAAPSRRLPPSDLELVYARTRDVASSVRLQAAAVLTKAIEWMRHAHDDVVSGIQKCVLIHGIVHVCAYGLWMYLCMYVFVLVHACLHVRTYHIMGGRRNTESSSMLCMLLIRDTT
jgi:hypothetical protein